VLSLDWRLQWRGGGRVEVLWVCSASLLGGVRVKLLALRGIDRVASVCVVGWCCAWRGVVGSAVTGWTALHDDKERPAGCSGCESGQDLGSWLSGRGRVQGSCGSVVRAAYQTIGLGRLCVSRAEKMGEIADVKEKLRSLKAELASARQAKNDGTFDGSNKGPINSVKIRRTLKGHFGKVYAMHWAGSGAEKLVSASQDGKLIIWNGNTTNKIQAIPLRSSWVMTCAFEQTQNKMVACGGLDNMCSIYTLSTDTALNRATCELAAHDGYLSCCRFLDPSRIITSSGDSTCILWNLNQNQVVRHFTDHSGDVMSVSPSPTDQNIFVSGSCDATCKLWDIRTSRAVITFDGHESDINDVCFFPNGNAFGTGSDDSSCRLYDLRAYQEINSFNNQAILCGITSVAFSSSGRLLIGGYDDFKANVWDTIKSDGPDSTTPVQVLGNHDNRVSCVGVQKDGQALCTGSWDTLLRIYA